MIFKSSFLQEASERGFLYQVTNINLLDDLLSKKTCTAYIGFDATADCLHVGHLLPIFLLRLFQKHGHKGIALFGGGTTKIGDPSFRNAMRPMLTNDIIKNNINGIKKCLLKLLNCETYKHAIEFADNANWLDGLTYVDFLRTVGIHFSVNKMIAFDSVKSRLTENNTISFMEFNYMLMQAYDFLELHKNQAVNIQFGGQDQWGNIVCGVELIRKLCNEEVIGCTVPLLTKPDGTKMGKSLSGAVWLHEDRLSPYDFWQYWRNIPDTMVGKCLRLFTDLSIDEIEKLEVLKDNEINEAKKVLANEITKIVHGQNAVDDINRSVATLFGNAQHCTENTPSVIINKDELENISIVDVIIRYGAANSRGEAKRLLRGGSVVINNELVDESFKISEIDDGKKVVIGKKRIFLIKIQ